MKKDNDKKILLLPAPKSPPTATAGNTADTASGQSDSGDRKYGENTGRDPTTGRFLTGNSGKPLGTQHFNTLFKKVIRQVGGVSRDGEKVTYDEIMVKKIVNMAADGNLKAAVIVLERVDGKVKLPIDIDNRIVGTVVLTQEEEERINLLFRKKPKEEKKNGESKQNGSAQGDRGGSQVSEGKPKGSAYERP